jgi:hypothetical protein
MQIFSSNSTPTLEKKKFKAIPNITFEVKFEENKHITDKNTARLITITLNGEDNQSDTIDAILQNNKYYRLNKVDGKINENLKLDEWIKDKTPILTERKHEAAVKPNTAGSSGTQGGNRNIKTTFKDKKKHKKIKTNRYTKRRIR